jgi:hypothetical protein
MIAAAESLAHEVGLRAVCSALSVPRGTVYGHVPPVVEHGGQRQRV